MFLQDNNNTNNVSGQANIPKMRPKVGLSDNRFEWREKKKATMLVADLLRQSAFPEYADRAVSCGSYLEYNFLEANSDGSNLMQAIDGEKQLSFANFCQLRTCPLCNSRRSRKLAVMLNDCMTAIEAEHPNVRYLFLTLTVKNCTADELVKTVNIMNNAFHKMMRRRPVERVVKGACRTMEITYNERQDTYHPHFHVILAVEDTYFMTSQNNYINTETWAKYWSESLKVDYTAIVNVKAVKNVASRKQAAIAEVSKYAVKDTDYLKLAKRNKKKAVKVIETFTLALYKRRLISCSGWFKDHWNEKAEEDLMHLTESGEKHSEWYGDYRYGYRYFHDYFLSHVYKKNEHNEPIQVQTICADETDVAYDDAYVRSKYQKYETEFETDWQNFVDHNDNTTFEKYGDRCVETYGDHIIKNGGLYLRRHPLPFKEWYETEFKRDG